MDIPWVSTNVFVTKVEGIFLNVRVNADDEVVVSVGNSAGVTTWFNIDQATRLANMILETIATHKEQTIERARAVLAEVAE